MPKRWSSCDELENAFCLVVYHCWMEVLKFYSAISHISYGVDFKGVTFFCLCVYPTVLSDKLKDPFIKQNVIVHNACSSELSLNWAFL